MFYQIFNIFNLLAFLSIFLNSILENFFFEIQKLITELISSNKMSKVGISSKS